MKDVKLPGAAGTWRKLERGTAAVGVVFAGCIAAAGGSAIEVSGGVANNAGEGCAPVNSVGEGVENGFFPGVTGTMRKFKDCAAGLRRTRTCYCVAAGVGGAVKISG